MLNKYKASQKRTDLYDIGDGMVLMNIVNKNEDGKIDSIYMYIGYEDAEKFLRVGVAEDLASPGSLFSYSVFMKDVSMRIGLYKEVFISNLMSNLSR